MKYRYVIIEDEFIVRRGVELKMHLTQLPFELVGVAENGREGLELIRREQPELAILDICMPEMDGVALLEAIRRENLSTELIVISGYSNFEYARAGIRADVCEYLLKPFSEDELRGAVMLAMERLRKRGLSVPEVASDRRAEEIRLLSDDLMGVLSQPQPSAFSVLNIDPYRGRYVVCEVFSRQPISMPTKPDELDELVCIDAPGLTGRSFVVCYNRTGISDALTLQVTQQLIFAESVGVSLPCNQLQTARRQAQEARRDHPILSAGAVSVYREPQPPEPLDDLTRDRWIFALETGDTEGFAVQFREHYRFCGEHSQSVNRYLRSLRLFLEYAIRHFSALSDSEMPTLFQFDYLTARCADDAQLPETILHFLIRAFPIDLPGSAARSIVQIRQYLDAHFGENLSLERVGQLFNVSPGYISRMFSQAFGTSYSGYITELRIRRSCELLSESETDVSAIAACCGFRSAKYFYKVFKSHIGCTPNEYRRQNPPPSKKAGKQAGR